MERLNHAIFALSGAVQKYRSTSPAVQYPADPPPCCRVPGPRSGLSAEHDVDHVCPLDCLAFSTQGGICFAQKHGVDCTFHRNHMSRKKISENTALQGRLRDAVQKTGGKLRNIANEIGVSPSHLSNLITGKRRLEDARPATRMQIETWLSRVEQGLASALPAPQAAIREPEIKSMMVHGTPETIRAVEQLLLVLGSDETDPARDLLEIIGLFARRVRVARSKSKGRD